MQDSIGHFIHIEFSLVELINNSFSVIQVSAHERHTELMKWEQERCYDYWKGESED